MSAASTLNDIREARRLTHALLAILPREVIATHCGVTIRTTYRWDNSEVAPYGTARRLLSELAAEHGMASKWDVLPLV